MISFKVARDMNLLPLDLKCFSLCKKRNFYWNGTQIALTDKQFNDIGKIDLPAELVDAKPLLDFYVSPCEKYILFDLKRVSGLSYLYELETMKMVRKFEYPCICDFTMVKDDTVFVISTWQGSFIGEV
jgi:hypothetical protein